MKKKIILFSALLFGGSLFLSAQNKAVTLTTARAAGESMTLMVNKTYNGVTVDWGDGVPQAYKSDKDVFHVIEGTVKGNTITISGDEAWNTLSCSNCELTAIDLSQARDLSSLFCQNNQLTTLDIREMPRLTDLDCSNNQLTEIIFTKATNPEEDVPMMENYNVSYNQLEGYTQSSTKNAFAMRTSSLQHVNASHNKYKVAYFIANTQLVSLNISNNELTSLSLQNNPDLAVLLCQDNALTSIRLSKDNAAAMKQMICDNNEIRSINISAASALTDFSCASNQINDLQISEDAKNIETLDVSDNALGINVLPWNNSAMRHLKFEPQALLDISGTEGITLKDGVPTVPVIDQWSERTKNPLDMTPYLVLKGSSRRDGKVTWFSVDEAGNATELTQGTSSSSPNDYSNSSSKFAFFTAHKKAYAEITSTKYDVKVQTTPIVIGDDITAIDAVIANGATSYDVYDLRGRIVKKGTSTLEGLQKGIYIINGQKVIL